MATKRKASAYSKKKPVIYTRWSKKQQLSFIKTVPPHKIVKFNMGDAKKFEEGKFKNKISLIADENVQIRDLALEAVRQSLNKDLSKLFQKDFFLRCEVFPHTILRNNRIFSGGSKGERIQTGMKQSFGSPEGRAAVVKKGKVIFSAYFDPEIAISKVRSAFAKVKPKLPCRTKILYEKISK